MEIVMRVFATTLAGFAFLFVYTLFFIISI